MWTKTLKIDGMTCRSCAVGIEKTLNQMKGVQIKVSYADAMGELKVRGKTSLAPLIDAIEGKGYQVSTVGDEVPVTMPPAAREEGNGIHLRKRPIHLRKCAILKNALGSQLRFPSRCWLSPMPWMDAISQQASSKPSGTSCRDVFFADRSRGHRSRCSVSRK